MRRRRRPARSMSWTPTIVVKVLTKSAMILKLREKKKRVQIANYSDEEKRYTLDKKSVGDSRLEEEGLYVHKYK